MERALNTALDTAVADGRIVGAVLLVEERGQLAFARAVGYADRAAKLCISPESCFRLTSATKPIMSTLFMRLVEEGTIPLSEPVSSYLPDFRPRSANGKSPDITLFHLLTHTSRLGYRFLESEKDPYARARVRRHSNDCFCGAL